MKIFATALTFLALSAAAGNAQTLLRVAATGSAIAPPDQMTASLTVQAVAPSAKTAQDKVNAMMAKALTEAHGTAGVTATTDGYNVQDTSEKQNGTQFQASQTLQLVSPAPDGTAPAAFMALLGTLQSQNLQLNGLDGGLSAAGQDKAHAQALKDAIHRLTDEANLVAAALGRKLGPIKTMDVQSNNPGPVFPARMMAMAKSAAVPPQSAPGPVTVTATVNAEIEIDP